MVEQSSRLFQVDEHNEGDAIGLLREIIKSQHEMHERLTISDQRYEALKATLESHVVRFGSAFPEGDAVAHRQAHEALIREHNERETFWRDMRMTLAKGGFLSAVTLLFALLIAGLIFTVTNSKLVLTIMSALRGGM